MKRTCLAILILLLIPHVVRSQALIQPGVSVISNSTLSVNNGIAFALSQGRGQIITWQTSFSVAPTAITVQLQFSLDNSIWFAVDTSTLTTGELRYLGPISARFIRCAVTVLTIGAGSGFTCRINVLGFNSPAAFSGGVLTSRLLLADGTGAAPSLAFASSPTWGMSKSSNWGIAFGIGAHQLAIDSLGPVLGSGGSLRWAVDSLINTSAYDIKLARTGVKALTMDDGAGGAASFIITGSVNAGAAGNFAWAGRTILRSLGTGLLRALNNAESRSLDFQAVDTPTCTTSCGTSPTASGVGSSFDIVMGASGVPASPFTITFATAWAAAPQCVGSMGTSGMVVGKLPLTFVTTTTTLVITTNGTAPSVSDRYHFKCSLGQ